MASLGTDHPVAARPAPLPRTYLVWLAATQASLLGDAALYFALGWAATAHGGSTAALVLTAVMLPRALFLLLGGAVGDRFGARRVLIFGDAAMLVTTLGLAVATYRFGTPVWLLVTIAALIGVVDAFHLPATGSMPRRLVGSAQLPRALALRQAGGQVAALLGAPLGAVLIASAGAPGAALLDAGTFAIVLVVLVCVRPAFEVERAPRDERLVTGAVAGVKLAFADPILRPALLLTAVAAGFLLPVVSLLNPLLTRRNGWDAGAAGLVAGGQSLGMIAVALLITRRGQVRRTGVGAALGLCVAAVGIAGMALAPTVAVAVIAGVVLGGGSGVFACHIGPLVLTGVPDTHLSRMQTLLTLVQSVALLPANNVLGALADGTGPTTATALCAAAIGAAGVAGLLNSPMRRVLRPE
ncbi:MFS transporter [Embleya scabrispora]|uniref:MFS transporter n=1 Tax=Embleya scabrispora TaxID=159449 RepID=UPI00037D65CB|nr:MFS transporter [Embleya scabrispora]MYS87551.1 MFS transporter [Streptomyces sp. SID5474]